jgi:hypothetical protein
MELEFMGEFFISFLLIDPDVIDFGNISILLTSTVPIKVYLNADLDKDRILKENFDKAGVYQFINLLTKESYVGSSTNLGKRLRRYYEHKFISSPAIGKSIILSSILKNGHSNFSLIILEFCEKKDTIDREQFYFDVIDPEMNILKNARNSFGYKHTKESLAKMSEVQSGDKHPNFKIFC